MLSTLKSVEIKVVRIKVIQTNQVFARVAIGEVWLDLSRRSRDLRRKVWSVCDGKTVACGEVFVANLASVMQS